MGSLLVLGASLSNVSLHGKSHKSVGEVNFVGEYIRLSSKQSVGN